ncbi:MAG: helix-turn-helix transcriptional regulator [Actinobacteria bacterium]|nr:helix-turn-helix transcriptional regulator [Actinomycetota bacterium]
MRNRFGLTARETEVLLLLVKGRDANYISNYYCVSQHTIKTHIYHIYRKTQVHARQGLIDLFEDALTLG